MKTVLVVAGNYAEFLDFKRFKENKDGPCNFIYVTDKNSGRGRQVDELSFIGTWYERRDADDIEAATRTCLM